MGEKISAMPAAAALTGTELVPVVQDGDNVKTTAQDIADLASAGDGYLVYTALLNQPGIDPPVDTVLQNTLSGAVVWTKFNPGYFIGTLAGAFPASKVFAPGGTINTFDGTTFWVERLSDDAVVLYTGSAGSLSDSLLIDTPIEIRVYP